MKIAITSQGEDLDSMMDERFGRAKGFIIFDDDNSEFTYIDNKQNLNALQGAGIQSGKTIINSGVKVLLTGNVGPKAFDVLSSADIEVYNCPAGTINDAIQRYKEGNLSRSSNANVEAHWE